MGLQTWQEYPTLVSQFFSFDTPRQPTEDTFVEVYLASSCMRSFRSGRPDYRAAIVAAVFGRPPVAI